MKKIKLITFISIITLFSCQNEVVNPNNTTQNEIEVSVETGDWYITKFIDSGVDETYHFNGYTFTFNDDGTLIADNGVNTYNGTWSISDDNSDDDTQDDLHFNIHFNLSNDFEDLNDDWEFISQTPSKIELIDISGGNGGIDYLTFEIN